MNAPIEFFFDFSSPYSYIANEWIDAVAARHGRTVRRHAILLGATFQVAELKSPVSYPMKREYSLRDFERSARFEGLPYALPPVFPIPTQNAARVFWWLAETQGEAAAANWARAGLRAVFTRGVPLHEAPALEALAARPPFEGRRPVMVGDDAGDESAFLAAERLGGLALRVAGEHFEPDAADFEGVGSVHAWLVTLAAVLSAQQAARDQPSAAR